MSVPFPATQSLDTLLLLQMRGDPGGEWMLLCICYYGCFVYKLKRQRNTEENKKHFKQKRHLSEVIVIDGHLEKHTFL